MQIRYSTMPTTAPAERAVTAAAGDTVAVFRRTREAVLRLVGRSQALRR